MNRVRTLAAASFLAAAAPAMMASSALAGQSIEARVNAVRDGTVLMSFPARPGVCGDGRGSVWTNGSHDGSWRSEWVCVHGPVRVSIGRSAGQTVSVRTHVGGEWTGASATETNLGDVSAPDAVRYLVELARTLAGSNAGHALSAATFADGVDISPQLAGLARDDGASTEARKQALFWLGQSDAPSSELVGLDSALRSLPLRKQFTFVLSQRRDDLTTAKLIDLATHDPDLQVRKQAMFWLGQSQDPKAIAFFREVLKP